MTEDWRDRFHRESDELISQFVADHPDYTGPEPMVQGWTSHVAGGTHDGQPIVYKVFNMHERWTNEMFLYRHYAHTGFVPALHGSVEPTLLVMDFVPGRQPRQEGIDPDILADPDKLAALSHHIGVATGALVSTPIPTDSDGRFPPPGFIEFTPTGWSQDIGASLQHLIDIGRRIHREVESFSDPVFDQSLDLLESQINDILDDRRIIHRADFGNLNVAGSRLMGFYDFESDHIGTESMIVTKLLGICQEYELDRDSLLAGYGSAGGNSSLAEQHLRTLAFSIVDGVLIRTSHDGRWTGSEEDLQRTQGLGAGMITRLRHTVLGYRGDIDLKQWFPGLL